MEKRTKKEQETCRDFQGDEAGRSAGGEEKKKAILFLHRSCREEENSLREKTKANRSFTYRGRDEKGSHGTLPRPCVS